MEEDDKMSLAVFATILGVPAGAGLLNIVMGIHPRLRPMLMRFEKHLMILANGVVMTVLALLTPTILGGTVYTFPLGSMRLDRDILIPVLATSVCFFLTSVYSFTMERGGRLSPHVYNFFALMFLVCMLSLMLVNDLIITILFVELVIAVSVVLVLHARGQRGVEASFKYLVITAVSALFVILGTMLIYVTTGTTIIEEYVAEPGPLRENTVLLLFIALCFIVGLGADIGLVPFHGWLPDSFPASTPVVNCLFAAEPISLFMALYKLVHPLFLISGNTSLSSVMVVIGLATLLFGVTLAYSQSDSFRMIAYTTVEEFGYVTLVLGLFSSLSYVVAQVHLMAVAIGKLGILMCLGSVIFATGTADMTRLGGLGRRMPLTSASYALSALSLAGMAPLVGFWTKYLVVGTVFNTFRVSLGLFPALGVMLVQLAAAFTSFVILVRSYHSLFRGSLAPGLENIVETNRAARLSTALAAGLALALGLMPHLLFGVIS
ncbi:MAG: complex I subunit 5 family protein [Candidatus Thorarchaeota archaeon]